MNIYFINNEDLDLANGSIDTFGSGSMMIVFSQDINKQRHLTAKLIFQSGPPLNAVMAISNIYPRWPQFDG